MTVQLTNEDYEDLVRAVDGLQTDLFVPEPLPEAHPYMPHWSPVHKYHDFTKHEVHESSGCAFNGCGASRLHPLHLA